MASSLGIAPLLRPVESLNKKWLERDPLNTVSDECVSEWYNELLSEKEIYIRPESFLNRNGIASHQSANGHFYCGQAAISCQCCNGVCGPSHGCNCVSCQEIEEELKENKDAKSVLSVIDHTEAWAWGKIPTIAELKNFTKLVAHKQLMVFKSSTDSLLFLQRLKARIYVYARFLSAYSKTCFVSNKDVPPTACSTVQDSNVVKSTPHIIATGTDFVQSGLNMLLKYTFKFIEKTWESGQNMDLCSEMLHEAFAMFQNMPKALLFDDTEDSKDLVAMVQKTILFLKRIVILNYKDSHLPIAERKIALSLLFELVFQRAALNDILNVILVCLDLSETGILEYVNLNSFLRKLLTQSTQMDFDSEILQNYYDGFSVTKSLGFQEFPLLPEITLHDQEERITEVVMKLMKIFAHMIHPYSSTDEKKIKPCCDDILVWGNLKLLSSLKEEKVEFKIATICCTDMFVIVLTLEGKVLRCEHNNEIMKLQPYEQVESLDLIQISCSYDGHFIALSKQKEIFTWQDNGAFDFFSSVPLQIQSIPAKIYAGFGYYSVLSKTSELFIWESTLLGRATHDSRNKQFNAREFTEISSADIIGIAFSQYHAEVIIITVGGKLWSWKNDKLTLLSDESSDIVKVYIAKYFYVALTTKGQVYRWGRDRFSKVQSGNLICLQSVDKLNKQNVLAISVGAYHCVALTDSYNVFCWGGLGGKEEEESLIREPVLLKAVSEVGVSHVMAGPHQIFCWSASFLKKIDKKVPFCIDVKKETFETLELLLQKAQASADEELKHCLLRSCLLLLKLQFQAAKKMDVSPQDIGFNGEEAFSTRLKDLVIHLVLQEPQQSELRKICEDVLECGWLYLLPAASDRAKTLTEFLKVTTTACNESHVFMLNLLINCLVQKNGLELLLEDTLDAMISVKKEDGVPSNTLYVLLKELFLANVITVLSTLDVNPPKSNAGVGREILTVLLKFQRLLFARIFVVSEKDVCWPARCYVYEPTSIIKCLTAIINFYMALLQSSCKQLLTCKADDKIKCEALMFSPIGVLFREFIHFMIMLQNYAPVITSNCDGLSQLAEILDLYSGLNKEMESSRYMGKNDMNWPLQPGECPLADSDSDGEENVEGFNNEDFNNALKNDQQLVKVDGQLFDLTILKADIPSIESSLDDFVGKEVASAFADVFMTEKGKGAMKRALVGDLKKEASYSVHDFQQVVYDIEVGISFLLGLHCCYLAHGMYPSQDETNNKRWLQSKLFSAGIDRDTVLRDIKRQSSPCLSADSLIKDTLEKNTSIFVEYVYMQAKCKGIPIIPNTDHETPVLDHVTRAILAVMIWHAGLEKELGIIQKYLLASETNKQAMESSDVMSDALFAAVKMALKERTSIFQRHQESQLSYDLLCAPILQKCKFLLSCLNPSCDPSLYKKTNKWYEVLSSIQIKYKFGWNLSKWGIKLYKQHHKHEHLVDVMQQAREFVVDTSINTDILRKCFLTQIKRAKQRLISGYLMQSLCLRKHLRPSVKASLLLGWLGLLVPGGSVSYSKPGILYNVELVSQDDIVKLKEVFKGFENFSLKMVFDELEQIFHATCYETNGAKKQIYKSSRALLLSMTVLTSSLMSGDVDFLLQCDVIDKIQTILKYCGEITDAKETSVPFIDERKHKQAHLLQLKGVEMIKLMKIGTRVGRGIDWKWDDQDGPPPSQGRLVSEIGEDGWVRVEWDTGSRNSYRMGKNGKYDLKIADSAEKSDDIDKDDNGGEKDSKVVSKNDIKNPFTFLSHTISSLIIHSLSVMACGKENPSQLAKNVVMKFLVKTLREFADDAKSLWGPSISVSATFGFMRALCSSEDFKNMLSSEDFITLLIKLLNLALLKHDKPSDGNSLFVKVQLVKLIKHSMMMKEKVVYAPVWKRWLIRNLFKLLTRILSGNKLYTTEQICDDAVKTAMTASVYTTVADELILLIRYLHTTDNWKDMISLHLWKSLKLLKVENGLSLKYSDQIKLFSSLCVIGGVESRVRIGGTARSTKHGLGTIANILPDGKILLYFGNSVKFKSCHLSKLDIIPELSFDMSSLTSNMVESLFALLKAVLNGPNIHWDSNLNEDAGQSMRICLYITSLHCLREICENNHLLYKFFKSQNTDNHILFLNILKKSMISSPVKPVYEANELELSAASLSQELNSKNNSQKDAAQLFSTINTTKNTTEQRPEGQSKHLLQLLCTMGFPLDYVKCAIRELGNTARPEQVVSWLLEHPDVTVTDNEREHSENNDSNPASVDITAPQSESMLIHSDDSILIDSDSEESICENDEQELLKLGSLVQCVQTTVNISVGDIGTIEKFLSDSGNVLVHWEKLDKALWITTDWIALVKSSAENSASLKVGSQVQLKENTDIHTYNMNPSFKNEVGTLINVAGKKAIVLFPNQHNPWEGDITDLKLVPSTQEKILHSFTNDECGSKSSVSCKTSKHPCVKELTVSSNMHIAARMINKEMDMAWISENTSQPHWIELRLRRNVVLSNLSVTLDPSDVNKCPTYFIVYGVKASEKVVLNSIAVSKGQNVVQLLGQQDKAYTYIKLSIKVGDENAPCKICHLEVFGEKQNEDYDQQIMKLFCCQKKPDDMRQKTNQVKIKEQGFFKQKSANKQVKVFCWGLNDKDQLGGMKGSKIKCPSVSEKLSSIQPCNFAGGSKTLFCVTYDGKVYACGESTCGRLGVGSVTGNIPVPRIIDGLNHVFVKKVSVHSGGRHAIALTRTGEAYSWGDGDDGKLGHGNTLTFETPQKIEALVGSFITDVACGSSHSAAIVNNQELYTWGLGDYGRLGHGDEVTQLKPKLVRSLLGYNVIDVSCGSRDAQTVCLTDDGKVWSWGDGDFGKLGRGGSDGCFTPLVIDSVSNIGVCKVLCGAQFNLAMTNCGNVWTWGKGDFFRLGHNSNAHVREPQMVEFLKDKHIVDVAVGALHCLAVTEDGEVYAWGDNDHGQQGTGTTTVNKIPTLVLGTEDHRIKHVACGSSHSIAWAETNPVSCFLSAVVSFPMNRDPLGANLILPKVFNETSVANIAKFVKDQGPSLIRSVLQISSRSVRQDALTKIMQANEIKFAQRLLICFMKFYVDFAKSNKNLIQLDFIRNFHQEHIIDVVSLLKLGLCGHLCTQNTDVVYNFLREISTQNVQTCDTLVNICLNELEEKIARDFVMQDRYKPCIQESPHPYHGACGVKLSGSVKYSGATLLVVEFDELSQTEPLQDVLTFFDGKDRTLAIRTGSQPSDWNTKLKISGEELSWCFTTNSPGGLWGFRFTVTPIPPTDDLDMDLMSSDSVLKIPCLELVRRLLACGVAKRLRDEAVILKLSSLLSMCIRIQSLTTEEKKWMLDNLHALLLSHNAPPIDVPVILNCSRYRDPSACKLRLGGNQRVREMVLSSTLSSFINGIPLALLKQYEFEEQYIRRGDQMTFSPFLRSLALLGCSLGLDTLPCCSNKHQWAWFGKYCNAIRVAQSFIQSSVLPKVFQIDVREKLQEILPENEILTFEYENNNLFSKAEDEQLLMWLNRRAQDWSVIWGGNGTVYGWGHNHRGQLGGIEGAKIKTPVICDSLAALKPVQMIGGEQTLFCVSVDGKVYASGYGNSSRLGLGNVESISTPRMIESLQHITIKKVAVHSGGRHCIALSSDGEVFSWGEGDDGKLGHGNRNSCSHPKLIESFRGKLITDISAGGSHSGAIGEHGELYTWGKGRYGRLGHGDGEDQLRPKVVEALQAFCVVDLACGSGDAQTLCITSDDAVWSWGDGDYGKLGRGGSDGCKIPMLIDDLIGKSVVKVECGSQFSMALTRHGALYTWGKGDYFRLGHGLEEHVRRPKRVIALETKVITAICCGSLHCAVCTEEGDVYCWGDNDEGQLGDGTTNAGQLPKLSSVLQNKKIDCIASGSAHTIAWSTCESIGHTLPAKIPIEYNHLQDIPMTTLRNRAFLLHYFSKLFCSCISLMELVPAKETSGLSGDLMVNTLKGLLLCSFKENSFRKIIDITMIRDRQHGPVIELNRVKNHRIDQGLAGPDGSMSVFGQITSKITEFSVESFCLPHRTWKVKFIGESVDDCGGGFSESIAEICEELQNGSLPLLILTPNSREESSDSNDYMIINPDSRSEKHAEMFHFLGIILGIAIRSGSPLSLSLAEPVWKLLVGLRLNLEDIEDIDRGFVAKYSYLSSLSNENSEKKCDGIEKHSNEVDDVTILELPYSVRSSSSSEVCLSQTETLVTNQNKQEYLKSALHYKLHECDKQIEWIRNGMSQVVPVPLISLFTGPELENMVCGSPEIHVDALRTITTYRGIEPSSSLVEWFWQVLEEFSNHERSLFLRFVWGRTRLPRTAMDFKGKDFIFQVLEKYHPADEYLPESYTCFFLLKMPKYTNVHVLREKLKYAIYFCKSIDSDDYARIDLTNS